MSIIDKLRQKAESMAHDGLEMLGVNYRPHLDVLNDDDPDTQSRDLIDIYKEMSEKWNSRGTMPVPGEQRGALLEEARKYCGMNDAVYADIEAWCSDRTGFVDEPAECPADALRLEMIGLLAQYGVIQKIGANRLGSAQACAKAQNRACFNFLYQADAQIDAADFDTWLSEMNDKLAMIELAVIQPVPETICLVDDVMEF